VTHAGKRLAVVIPALDEEASIAAVVADFRAQPEVDEVVVVDNGSRDSTAARARAAGARVIPEARRGYGAALRRGIEEALAAGAERVALCEADGTFAAEELALLLDPLASADLVLGSRARHLAGALGLGNRLVARLLSALWPRRSIGLSDVGCTYRAFTADTWRRLAPELDADGPAFSPQMMCAAFRAGLAVREVSVQYGARTGGSSKHTGDVRGVLRTALVMLRAILRARLRRARRANA
jgi:glycosyltransferase involved in cell wall biosynthesis